MTALLLLALACAPKAPKETAAVSENADALAQRPEVGQAPAFAPAVPTLFTLGEGGPEVWLLERPGLPLVSLRLIVPGGAATDPADAHGLTRLTDTLLTRGAGERDALAFAEEVERQGLSLSVSTGSRASVVQLDTHAERLDSGLALLADAVLQPRFDADEVARTREQQSGDVAQALDSPASVAVRVADFLYYGEGHPLAHPISGSQASVEALTDAQVKASWSQRYTGQGVKLMVVGDIDQATLIAALEAQLQPWVGVSEAAIPEGLPSGGKYGGDEGGLYLVDNPGASQSVLRIILPGPDASSPEALPARLGLIVLGGTFTSRLNRLLREEKGYTYGARASLDDHADHGRVVTNSAVRGDVTAEALADMLSELRRVTEGIDAAELEKAIGARRTSLISAMETRAGTAGTLAQLDLDGLESDAIATELAALDGVTLEQVNAWLAGLNVDQAMVLVVGDLKSVQAPLAAQVPGDWQVVEKR